MCKPDLFIRSLVVLGIAIVCAAASSLAKPDDAKPAEKPAAETPAPATAEEAPCEDIAGYVVGSEENRSEVGVEIFRCADHLAIRVSRPGAEKATGEVRVSDLTPDETILGGFCTIRGKPDPELLALGKSVTKPASKPEQPACESIPSPRRAFRVSRSSGTITELPVDGVRCAADCS